MKYVGFQKKPVILKECPYKILVKEIKKELIKRHITCSWIRLYFVKISVLPNLSYTLNTVLIKSPKLFFGYQPTDFKIYMEMQKRPRTVQNTKEQSWKTDTS